MTRVLISGYYGYDNFGDEAILSVIIDHFRRKNANITVLSHSPMKTRQMYGVNSVKNFNLLSVLLAVMSCDVLISGGGSLLQDVTSSRSLKYYSFIIKLAQYFHKKVIIFAQGIGPLNSEKSRQSVIEMLNKCDLVTVRDLKSQEFLKANGVSAELVSDPVFSVDLPQSESEGIVGVQLREYKAVDDAFLFELGQQVITYFGDRKIELFAFQKSLDFPVCKRFEKILKTLYPEIQVEIIHSVSQNDIIMRISRLEYMIAMRFHAVLVAIKTGVKTLAINYDAKVEKLAYDAFLPLLTISVEENFEAPFERLLQLNPQDLLDYSNSQSFEWDLFDSFVE